MDLKEKVFSCIAKSLNVDKGSLALETTFQQLGADSLDMVEFSMGVEDEFGITFEQDDVMKIKTVGDAISLIEQKTKK